MAQITLNKNKNPRDCFSFLRGALNPRAVAAAVYVLDDDARESQNKTGIIPGIAVPVPVPVPFPKF